MNENRGQVIRDVIGIVGGLVQNRANQNQAPIQAPPPPPQKEKTDYTPFIIAGAFTIISALIISRGR